MNNNVYVLYNTLSKRYGEVMAFPSDSFALKRIMETLTPDKLSEFELCRIGSIGLETGVVTPIDIVRVAWPDVAPSLPLTNN